MEANLHRASATEGGFRGFLGDMISFGRTKEGPVAKEAAEKGAFSGKMPEQHPAGAKARPLFCGIYGTTEVVP